MALSYKLCNLHNLSFYIRHLSNLRNLSLNLPNIQDLIICIFILNIFLAHSISLVFMMDIGISSFFSHSFYNLDALYLSF